MSDAASPSDIQAAQASLLAIASGASAGVVNRVRQVSDVIDMLAEERDAWKILADGAVDRLSDMLKGDDGQAWKEARKFLERNGRATSPTPLQYKSTPPYVDPDDA